MDGDEGRARRNGAQLPLLARDEIAAPPRRPPPPFAAFVVLAAALTAMLPRPGAQPKAMSGHALSMYGDLKYGPGFKHFDYVNPSAPKGGDVKLAAIGTFDNLNPFILKGN